uniref:Uncharacterized protein n=1 Tax=Desulfobacca acetoxidans TaxID=60893 RepID=A0A7C5EKS5_9BACT
MKAEAEDFPSWSRQRLKELRELTGGRLCTPEQKEKCQAEDGAFAGWACQVCREYLRVEAIDPWTWHLLWLHRLKKAGYPFRANDLSLELWLLLDLVEEALKPPQGGRGDPR